MTALSIGGKVLDSSAVAKIATGWLSALTWLDLARSSPTTLCVPSLALVEVHSVMPAAGQVLADLRVHPSVRIDELDATSAAAVADLLDRRGVFDVLAAHVVYVAQLRGWPVLSADPDRLRRIEPSLHVDEI